MSSIKDGARNGGSTRTVMTEIPSSSCIHDAAHFFADAPRYTVYQLVVDRLLHIRPSSTDISLNYVPFIKEVGATRHSYALLYICTCPTVAGIYQDKRHGGHLLAQILK